MNKQTFFAELRKGLCGFSQDEIEERLAFYAEMIDDRMEEGFSEEDAVSAIGSVDDIVAQILEDIPLTKIVKEKIKPKRRLNALEITLLAVGSPVWLSLLISAFAIVFSLYLSFWSVIVSLWAVFVAFGACALGGIVAGAGFFTGGYGLTGIVMISTAIICMGFAIFFFFGCKYITKGMLLLSKKGILSLKKRALGKDGTL